MCCCSSSSIIYFQSSRHLKAKAKTPSCRSSAGTVGSSACAQTVQTMLCESNFLLLFITCSSKFDCFDTNWMYFGTGLGAWHSRTPDSTLWVTQTQSEWENTCELKHNWKLVSEALQMHLLTWLGVFCRLCPPPQVGFAEDVVASAPPPYSELNPSSQVIHLKENDKCWFLQKIFNFTWISSLCCCMCFKALFRCWLCHFCLIINLFDQEEQLRSDYVYKQCLKIYWLL